jgi:hypothetical protein
MVIEMTELAMVSWALLDAATRGLVHLSWRGGACNHRAHIIQQD